MNMKTNVNNYMKKGIIAVAAWLLASTACFAQFSGGDGSKENPYILRTNDDLKLFAQYVNEKGDESAQTNWSKDKYFVIDSDSLTAEVSIGHGGIAECNLNDKVKLKLTADRYCTGERIPEWCKNRYYSVMQVGTKNYPNGILLKEIYSWVPATEVLDGTYTFQGELDGKNNTLFVNTPEAKASESDKVDAFISNSGVVKNLNQVRGAAPKAAPAPATKREIEHRTPDTQSSGTIVYMPKEEQVENPDSVAQAKLEELLVEKGFHQFSIGVRGGTASLMQNFTNNENGKWNAGYNALLDLQYAYYFKKKNPEAAYWGIRTGVSVGYMANGAKSGINDQYSITDVEGDNINYTVTADKVVENDAQIQVEIPIMATVLYKGLFANFGPKVVLPVFSHYSQKVTNPNVIADFTDYSVVVPNEVITGMVTDDQTKGKWDNSKFNLMLTAEIGYEWTLKNKNSFGIGAFANYSVLNTYKNDASLESLIQVTTKPGENPNNPQAIVDLFSVTESYVDKMGYFDCGVKLVYNFNFFKK